MVPTCHRNDLLAKCLTALAPGSQTIDPAQYEVIVTDDGSKETAEKLVGQSFPAMRWVKGPRKGPAGNRNNGARGARGEWIAFTDDDCIPDANWLAAFSQAVKDGIDVYEGRTTTDSPDKGIYFTAPVNETGGKLWSCNMMLKAARFWSLGGFDEAFPFPHLEDVDFRYRMEKARIGSHFVREAVVLHPQRPIAPIAKQALGYESYFYYARKHGLSLAEAGFGWPNFFKHKLRLILRNGFSSKSPAFFCRTIAEFYYLVRYIPGWRRQYGIS